MVLCRLNADSNVFKAGHGGVEEMEKQLAWIVLPPHFECREAYREHYGLEVPEIKSKSQKNFYNK